LQLQSRVEEIRETATTLESSVRRKPIGKKKKGGVYPPLKRIEIKTVRTRFTGKKASFRGKGHTGGGEGKGFTKNPFGVNPD